MSMSAEKRRELLASRVHAYFEGCNEANREKSYSCFAENVVYYFSPGVGGPYVAKRAIADL